MGVWEYGSMGVWEYGSMRMNLLKIKDHPLEGDSLCQYFVNYY